MCDISLTEHGWGRGSMWSWRRASGHNHKSHLYLYISISLYLYLSIYLSIYQSMYIYIYTWRERHTYIYIYNHIHMMHCQIIYTCIRKKSKWQPLKISPESAVCSAVAPLPRYTIWRFRWISSKNELILGKSWTIMQITL